MIGCVLSVSGRDARTGPLIFEARVPGATYRTMSFGLIAAGAGSGAGDTEIEVVISPSEAGVRLLDENQLENFDDQGIIEVMPSRRIGECGNGFQQRGFRRSN